jgi:hypothetical protein
MNRKRFFDLRRPILIHSVDIQNSAIKFIEPDASEKTIEITRPNNEGHAGRDRLVLNGREVHYRSPGDQTDAGSLADILFGRSATRWLRL